MQTNKTWTWKISRREINVLNADKFCLTIIEATYQNMLQRNKSEVSDLKVNHKNVGSL